MSFDIYYPNGRIGEKFIFIHKLSIEVADLVEDALIAMVIGCFLIK